MTLKNIASLLFLLGAAAITPAAAQEKSFTQSAHMICGSGLHCIMSPGPSGPIPHCMPPGAHVCGTTVCSSIQICMSRTLTSGGHEDFCGLPGSTVSGSGICGAGYSCAPASAGGGHVCVVTGSKACGPSLRCAPADQCYSAMNVPAKTTMYHCAVPGSTVCGPSFVCTPGQRCQTTVLGKETLYRCLGPNDH